jgi:hypothetical protein
MRGAAFPKPGRAGCVVPDQISPPVGAHGFERDEDYGERGEGSPQLGNVFSI